MKTYIVNYVENVNKEEVTNSKDENIFWDKGITLSDFTSPWDQKVVHKIEFKAVWNNKFIRFKFQVFDNDIHIDKKEALFDSINNSDRVKLFFRLDEKQYPSKFW